MSGYSPKLVDTPHYHLWTDALHAQALAHQARNKWDRGTYVRWTVVTAWTVFEMGCREALDDPEIGHRFKDDVDRAVSNKSLPRFPWGSGIWQRIRQLQKTRKDYIHPTIPQQRLFPDASGADNAIEIVREGIKAVYNHAGKACPTWIDDHEDRGWDDGGGPSGHAYLIQAGADENDPMTIRIAYVYRDREYVSQLSPPGTDPGPLLDDLIRRIRVPISAVRAYRGMKLIEERRLTMRGA